MYGNNQGLDFLVVVYISIGTIRNCYKKQNLKFDISSFTYITYNIYIFLFVNLVNF